jgi:hypothetical protein
MRVAGGVIIPDFRILMNLPVWQPGAVFVGPRADLPYALRKLTGSTRKH